ncbi:hypothetical protein J6590_085061 [Homalodisca vitripennis]|nr:hypothetical protein J6590_085061 [Homalodisca vitripennis]
MYEVCVWCHGERGVCNVYKSSQKLIYTMYEVCVWCNGARRAVIDYSSLLFASNLIIASHVTPINSLSFNNRPPLKKSQHQACLILSIMSSKLRRVSLIW